MQEAPTRTFVPVMPSAEDCLILGLETLPAQRVAQIQAMYDGVPVGLCFLDRKMRFVSLNRRLADMNGAPVMAHLGKTVEEVIPHLFPQIEPFIRRALGGEPVLGVEVQQGGPEQGCEAKTVLLCYQPARDEAGEVLGVSVAVMDITEHKRTENALRESVDHFRYMLELGPHVPWVLNEKGEVVAASPRWETLTGQTLEAALGNGWQAMLHPEDLEPTLKAMGAALTDGEAVDIYYRVRGARGGWMLMRSRGGPRFGATGNVIGVYGVVEEVSRHSESPDTLEMCEAEL
jgi:PAS domain S-box-containing protein